ncbi:MAG: DUF3306 domain-containing protein [Betaproteobacteria bacterium]|jgi:hypothetical protein|nr:MAG: DUF3306 domain-containing protein [Betaproteobacteria bacterium]
MSDNSKQSFLGRWSRLKRDARASEQGDGPLPADGVTELLPARAAGETAAAEATRDTRDTESTLQPPELPSIDSLDSDSDFAAFMDPRVDDDVRRVALKTLFRDPDFNLADGLDVYVEDYTKLEKLTPAMVAALRYAQRTLIDEDCERAVADGHVSEVHSSGVDGAIRAEPHCESQGIEAANEAESNDLGDEQVKFNEAEAGPRLSEPLQIQDDGD